METRLNNYSTLSQLNDREKEAQFAAIMYSSKESPTTNRESIKGIT